VHLKEINLNKFIHNNFKVKECSFRRGRMCVETIFATDQITEKEQNSVHPRFPLHKLLKVP
jgi:hypothetical protein